MLISFKKGIKYFITSDYCLHIILIIFYLGAPRLLQCIAQDEVVPELKNFRKLTKRNEPFQGYVLNISLIYKIELSNIYFH